MTKICGCGRINEEKQECALRCIQKGKTEAMAKHNKKSTFFKDFKAFISKGNVVDMAVGVVIGGAFGKIVTGLVNYIINPFVGLFVKSGSLDSLKTVIHEATYKADGVTVDQAEVAILWGTWLQTIIDFLITALCIFVVLRIIVKAKNLAEYKKTMEAEAKAEADKKAAEEKAAEEKAAAEALAAKQARLEESTLKQEQLLVEIRDLLQKK